MGKKNDNFRSEILFFSLGFFSINIVNSTRRVFFPFLLFVGWLVCVCECFFPFGFYRWLRFNSLLIRRWSSRGSLVRSVFWKLPRLFFFPVSFGLIVFWVNGKPWFTFPSRISLHLLVADDFGKCSSAV